MPSNRLSAALRAGVVAYAVAVLLAALVAAPLIADRSVGHLHPDGVAAHTHPLTQILASDAPPTTPSGAPVPLAPVAVAVAAAALFDRRPAVRARSRAPPSAI